MPNAKDAAATPYHKILALGRPGSGKTSNVWTLPGKKFAYIFDPNSLLSLSGLDVDYEEFLPEVADLDITLKGFNKGSKSDTPRGKKEPTLFLNWGEDFDKRISEDFFAKNEYKWLVIDSLTLLANSIMDRQMFLNGRYGGIEDRADYRVVGNKIASIFRAICAVPINLYCTGHISSFQDEKTQRIEYQINLPGSARTALPLLFSNIWEMRQTTEQGGGYSIYTKAEARGFQDIRTSLQGLKPVEDGTIKDFNNPTIYGVGRLLKEGKPRVTQAKPIVASTPQSTLAKPPSSAAAGASAATPTKP